MVELKTLEDIREEAIKDICKNIKAEPDALCSFGPLGLMSVRALVTTFLSDGLKQEAIKHIKELSSPAREITHGPCCTCQECGFHHDDCICEERKAKIEWINGFFSVTKEDLK